MRDYGIPRILLVVFLLTTAASPTFAAAAVRPGEVVAARPVPAAVVLADGWSIGKLIGGGGRTRVVQFCVVVMCLALFIMMKKLT